MRALRRRQGRGDASFSLGWFGHRPAIRRAAKGFNGPGIARGLPPQIHTALSSRETSGTTSRIWSVSGARNGMRIAVIGTGIAGNAAAWTLSKRYPVTVYEREIRPGGHSHTVTIDYDGTPGAVDIGFIVYSELS